MSQECHEAGIPSGRNSGVSGAAEIRDAAESWPVASSAELASGILVRLHRDAVRMPGGELAEREVVEHPGAVAILALDESGRVLMIRQYRHPVSALLWEIPAGLRDVPGESLQETAERELLEETGHRAADWRVLADVFTSPGFSTERLRIFLARDVARARDEQRSHVPKHEEAHLQVAWVPLQQALAAVLAGDLHNGVAAVGILSAYAARADGFAALRRADAPEMLTAGREVCSEGTRLARTPGSPAQGEDSKP
jgi:8-oxo-dGTP pyrophosphatase MutT (NUDIX family)